jgi:hypothetical protein
LHSLASRAQPDYILSLLYEDRGWLMEAVQSKKVADKGRNGAFLTGCAGITNNAVACPTASLDRTAAERSRVNSSSTYAGMPQSRVHSLSKTIRFCGKLNRQIPEVETTLSLRKQRSANCSNRQKITFCKSENPCAAFALSCPEPFSRRPAPSVFLNRNQPISNRELLVLEIPQPAENKHRPPALIENFEPNHSRSFRAFVAAAFRRAASACQSPIQAGESAKPEGRSK